MTMILEIVLGIVMVVILGYVGLVTLGYDNLRGITLQLDEMYTDINEMACVVFAELKKQGRECEVIEMGKGYPKFMVDGKKYIMISKMASVRGIPVQTVQLKVCKE